MGLRRELVVAGLAAVAQDRPDDQALDDEEDHDRDPEHDVVEVADLLALDALRLGREEAVPERLGVERDQGSQRDRTAAVTSQPMIAVVDGLLPGGGRHRQSSNSVAPAPRGGVGAARWRSEPARRPHPTQVGSAPIITEQARRARRARGAGHGADRRPGQRPGRRGPPAGSARPSGMASEPDRARMSAMTPRPPPRTLIGLPLGLIAAGAGRWAPSSPTAPSRPTRRPSPTSSSAGRSSRPSSCPSSSPRSAGSGSSRRIDRAHPANPVPRRRTVAFLGRPLRDRGRAPVGDRRLRHDALLDPHGPAPAPDPRRRSADRPRRPDHDSSPGGHAERPPSGDPADPPLADDEGPLLPGRHLDRLRRRDVGHPLLAAVRRLARGPADPRSRARPVPRPPASCSGGRPSGSIRARGGCPHPVRAMYVFLQMPQNTFLAVTILNSGVPSSTRITRRSSGRGARAPSTTSRSPAA